MQRAAGPWGRGGRTRLPASYSRSLEFFILFWSVCVCVCVWCAAVQGVFCNDGNRQSLGHQERAGSLRAAAHRRPWLRRIKEAGGKKRKKSSSFQVPRLRLFFPLSCILLRFIPTPAAFYSNGILNVFSLKKQSTICARHARVNR